MSKRASPTLIGLFVLGAIALSIVAIVLLGSGRLFRDSARFVVWFPETVHGLSVGSAVKFKGVPVGRVADIGIDLGHLRPRPNEVRVPVVIELDEDLVGADGFDLDDPRTLKWLIAQGLRAQLDTESIITGLRFVSLDMQPDKKADLVADPAARYPEIPAVPSFSARTFEGIARLVENVSQVDVARLGEAVRELADAATELLSSPDLARAIERLDAVVANLDRTLVELRRVADRLGPEGELGRDLDEVAASMRRLLRPDGAFYGQLEETLTEVQEAARSLRRLADQLGRDPGSILRGGRP